MSGWSWGSGSGDASWWDYALSAAAGYASSASASKDKKKDRQARIEELMLVDRLRREDEERKGKLLSDAYSNYSQFYKPPTQANPMASFPQGGPNLYNPQQGLLTYGKR